ncbi:MAG: CPBP family intramembrane metalloprotease [Phycisphaerales bacterium]|nr:MAG: CPBP family intramembrane metalloprotease [Phycisphaerales bacterium]
MTKNPPTDNEQHSLSRSLVLHLLPGVLILLFFAALAPVLRSLGFPSLLAQFLAVTFALIPFELGCILYQAKRQNRTWSLKGIVLYREKIPNWQYVAFIPPLLAWALVCFILISPPIDKVLIESYFSWLPDWFFLYIEPGAYSKGALWLTWFVGVLFNGLAGPMVEELYFRGYLLPRVSRLKGWAPIWNVVLFSVYHFFTPWQNPARILALLPGAHLIQWKKNIYLGMIPHCLLNTTGMLLMLPLLLK